MNCPRCATELTTVSVESALVKACPNCEGTWYPDEALGIVTDHTLSELTESGLSSSLVPDQLSKVNLDDPVRCPECQEFMSRFTYSLTCPILLDECAAHGVWLDDGELGALMQHLTDLDNKVGAYQEKVLNSRNLQTLAELSKSPAFYNLPSKVLATINSVYKRDRT